MGSSKSLERGLDASSTTSWVFFEFVFPDDEDTPAQGFELLLVKPVPFYVPFELPPPERGVRLGERQVLPRAAVPETAVDEHGQSISGINQVGAPWQTVLP
jgi:hypothetical protein